MFAISLSLPFTQGYGTENFVPASTAASILCCGLRQYHWFQIACSVKNAGSVTFHPFCFTTIAREEPFSSETESPSSKYNQVKKRQNTVTYQNLLKHQFYQLTHIVIPSSLTFLTVLPTETDFINRFGFVILDRGHVPQPDMISVQLCKRDTILLYMLKYSTS